MNKQDFFYDLPDSLIAQTPLNDRSHSRLMVLNKQTGAIKHQSFYDILEYLHSGDLLVLNDTKVIPARLKGYKINSKLSVELLLIKPITYNRWETMVYPGKKLKVGAEIFFHDQLQGKIEDILDNGNRIVEFSSDGDLEKILQETGEVPLPPYITEKLEDSSKYQTVYANKKGSCAAPTAGLHFTPDLLLKIKDNGIQIAFVTLHVGVGTFRPVKSEKIEDHTMHKEYFELPQKTADLINQTKLNHKKIIAVGTTTIRAMESSLHEGKVIPQKKETDIFIYPGYTFQTADMLITNFHLPESTLIMLVSAFAGKEKVFHAYHTAVKEKYRFFSFGDAMLIQ